MPEDVKGQGHCLHGIPLNGSPYIPVGQVSEISLIHCPSQEPCCFRTYPGAQLLKNKIKQYKNVRVMDFILKKK